MVSKINLPVYHVKIGLSISYCIVQIDFYSQLRVKKYQGCCGVKLNEWIQKCLKF